MSTFNLRSIPFVCHIILEVPAAFAFALFPSATLRSPQPDAHAVIRQYALLLTSTVIIAIIFGLSSRNEEIVDPLILRLQRQVAGALALYHFSPMLRAVIRLQDSTDRSSHWAFLHLLSHGVGGTILTGRALDLW